MSDIQSNWHQFADKVKAKWHQLTDADLAAINGKREALQHKLEELGHAQGEAQKQIKDWEE